MVVLTGKGKWFCTGMNLGAQGEGMKGNNAEQFRRASQMYKTVEEFPKPVIAVINGTCCGEGNGLAMACDIGIAAKEDITFNLSEVKIGLIPAIISRYIVPEWGVAKACEAMLTARSIPVAELSTISLHLSTLHTRK